VLEEPWAGGEGGEICEEYDRVVCFAGGSKGVYIENAKGTLVRGGQFAQFEYGIEVGESGMNQTLPQNTQTQIFGSKFDDVCTGVVIGANTERTQVYGVTRANSNNHVLDEGNSTIVVGHNVMDPVQDDSVLFTQNRAHLPSSLEVEGEANFQGRVDMTQSGVLMPFITVSELTDTSLNTAFNGNPDVYPPDGFVALVYSTGGTSPGFHLVSRHTKTINAQEVKWQTAPLSEV